eukprot:gene44374-37402_t
MRTAACGTVFTLRCAAQKGEECATLGSAARSVVTNHCPNHPEQSYNPNYAVKQSTTYTLPLRPELVTSADYAAGLGSVGGSVGVAFDGAQIYSAYGGPDYSHLAVSDTNMYTDSAPYAEGYSFDACGEHASSSTDASYHLHVPPSCLLRQLGQTDTAHSPQIGWMVDGFPIYGPRGPGGVMMKRCTEPTADPTYCTDMCGGRASDTDVADGYAYRYYVMGPYKEGTIDCTNDLWVDQTVGKWTACGYDWAEQYYPFTPLCLRGCCPDGVSCSREVPACSGYTTSAGTTATFDAAKTNPALSYSAEPAGCTCASFPYACANADWGSSGRTPTPPTPAPAPDPPTSATTPAPP